MARKPQEKPMENLPELQYPNQEESGLKSYSFQELLDLRNEVDQEIQERQSAELASHREKTLALAKALGITIEQMFGIGQKATRKPRSGDGKSPRTIGYRDPANPDNVASMKGPKPAWLKAYIDQGRDPEEFRIK